MALQGQSFGGHQGALWGLRELEGEKSAKKSDLIHMKY